MYRTISAFAFLLLLLIEIAGAQNPVVIHYVDENVGYRYNHVATWVNNATLRSEPSRNASAIETIPIGTICSLIKSGKDTVEIAGIQSPWYYLEADGKRGWIWGGLLTRACVGSNVHPEVKFLLGYQLYDDIKGEGFKQTFMQLRAIKNHEEIASISFPLLEPMYEFSNAGSKGLEGIEDILSVVQSGESCGHFSGSSMILWDGKKFYDPLVIGGVADGDYSIWDSPIFPSDMEGEKDYLILDSEDYNSYESFEEESNGYVMERIAKQTYMKWEKGTWKEDQSRFQSKTLYYTVNGTIGENYFSEDQEILPNEIDATILDWINSHKRMQK
jgi:hypothetical protein